MTLDMRTVLLRKPRSVIPQDMKIGILKSSLS